MSKYTDQLLVVLKDVESWKDLKSRLATFSASDDIKVKSPFMTGKLFEYFCKYYFLVEPTVKDDFKEVWLFDEIPIDIKHKLNFTSQDYGVDLLLKDINDKYVALQCKYRNDESVRLSWSKDKIANLFAYGNKAERFAVFSNVSDLDKVSKEREGNFTFYNISDLLSIQPLTFNAIIEKLKGKTLLPEYYKPMEHQQEAINTVINHFRIKDRAQLILPCGAGKTLTALWIKEKLESKNTLLLVPSLALLRQTKNEWASQKSVNYKYIFVCSEKDIDKRLDSPITHTYELGGNVTSKPDNIAKFLLNDENKVVFSTYQSLPEIEKSVKN